MTGIHDKEFTEKKHGYADFFNSLLFPQSAAVLEREYFSYKPEYINRQRAYVDRLCHSFNLK